MWPRALFRWINFLGIVLHARACAMTLALRTASAPALAQYKPLTNHLLERAEAGHLQEQLDTARAFQLGLGVDRDPLRLPDGSAGRQIKAVQKHNVSLV